jgi:hypothetical protein
MIDWGRKQINYLKANNERKKIMERTSQRKKRKRLVMNDGPIHGYKL